VKKALKAVNLKLLKVAGVDKRTDEVKTSLKICSFDFFENLHSQNILQLKLGGGLTEISSLSISRKLLLIKLYIVKSL